MRLRLGICTWNSQGDPTTDSRKLELLDYLCSASDVVLLQECGALRNIDVLDGIYYCKIRQAGAFNIRCSTAILSRMPFEYDTEYLQSGTGRSLIIAEIESVPFAVMTMHAEAWTGSDVWPAICDKNYSFILGGDMNCTPYNLRCRHPYDFDNQNGWFVISASNNYTHTHRYELDYFIHTPDIACYNTQRVNTTGGSDHYPVFTEAY